MNKDLVIKIRCDLHRIPETAYTEKKTANYVTRYLKTLDLDVHTGIAQSGVMGVMENPTVDYAIGCHLWPDIAEGTIGVKAGPLMAASNGARWAYNRLDFGSILLVLDRPFHEYVE